MNKLDFLRLCYYLSNANPKHIRLCLYTVLGSINTSKYLPLISVNYYVVYNSLNIYPLKWNIVIHFWLKTISMKYTRVIESSQIVILNEIPHCVDRFLPKKCLPLHNLLIALICSNLSNTSSRKRWLWINWCEFHFTRFSTKFYIRMFSSW